MIFFLILIFLCIVRDDRDSRECLEESSKKL